MMQIHASQIDVSVIDLGDDERLIARAGRGRAVRQVARSDPADGPRPDTTYLPDGEVFSAAIGRAHVFFFKSRNHARRANAGEAGRKA
jgi:hypothetical protein